VKRRMQIVAAEFEMHSHCFVSGPRSKSGRGKDGKWHTRGEVINHSHPGGGVPHLHPETGPSFYGHRQPKITKRPTGEQFEVVAMTEEESSFEVVVMDSALVSTAKGLVPIGNTPLKSLGFPAAERMMTGSRLKCIVRDERSNKPSGGAA
jgi:hypothetical protein